MSRYKTLISYMFVALWLTNNRLGQKKKGSGRREFPKDLNYDWNKQVSIKKDNH